MRASTFDRLHPAIAGVVPDIEAEADFLRLPDEVAAFACPVDVDATEDMRGAISGALPRRRRDGRRVTLNPRPHVRAEVFALQLAMAMAVGRALLTEADLAALIVALGRKRDQHRADSLKRWGEVFGESLRAAPSGIDPIEWVALQLIVATRRGLASGMVLRRAVIGLVALCWTLDRAPPPAVIMALACVVGVIDPWTAAPVWPRLSIIAGADARTALVIARCDVDAGERASPYALAVSLPDLTRPQLYRARKSSGYRLAHANLSRDHKALAALYPDTETPVYQNPKMSVWCDMSSLRRDAPHIERHSDTNSTQRGAP